MLCKSSSGDKSCGQLKKRLRLFSSKMTGVSTYERMDKDAAEKKKKKRLSEVVMEDKTDKENNNVKDVGNKKQKKKRSWKRFRQVALTTCRYIGMGVAHMSPATVHSAPDYYMDPKYWNKSFSPSCKQTPRNTPHWTNNMFVSAW